MWPPLSFAGAQIHYESASPEDPTYERSEWGAHTDLLDFTPGTSDEFGDANLGTGKEWSDPYGTTRLRVLDDDGWTLTVSVNEPHCASFSVSGVELASGPVDGSISVSAPQSCSWSAVSTAAWLAITGNPAGSGNGTIKYHADPNPSSFSRRTVIAAGGTGVRVSQFAKNQPPNGASAQTGRDTGPTAVYHFSWSDPNGHEDLAVLRVRIGESSDGCNIEYATATKVASLPGGTTSTRFVPNGSLTTVLENSACAVDRFDPVSIVDRTTLGTTAHLIFKSLLVGTQAVYLSARDRQGADSPWTKQGSFLVTPDRPARISLSPNKGSGWGKQEFSLSVSDPDGAEDVRQFTLRFIRAQPQRECQILLWRYSNLPDFVKWLVSITDTGGTSDDGARAASLQPRHRAESAS